MADDAGACDDPGRLAALRRYQILDTPRDPAFDGIVELAARVCRTPIAVINLIESRRQWFKSEVGLGVRETPLDVSICRNLLLSPGLTVIPDTRDDARLRGNPFVAEEPGLRFYAGCLLESADGHGIGTLCVLDHRPRDLDSDQCFALRTLADQVMAQLNLRLALRQKDELLAQRELLMQELNHRVKNSLQLISGIVGLARRSVRDPAASAALDDVRGRIVSVAAVHEHLYRAGDGGLDTIELAAFLRSLLDELRRSAPGAAGIEFRAEGPVPVPLAWAVPLALVANELVTNALKHAYPEGVGGPVRVALSPLAAGGYALTIADEGRGLPPGFDPAAAETLGIRLLGALAAQIGAAVSRDGSGPRGARFTVAFGTDAARSPPA